MILWHAFLFMQFAGAMVLSAGVCGYLTLQIAERCGIGHGSRRPVHKLAFALVCAAIIAGCGFAIDRTVTEFMLTWESGLALGALCGLWFGYLQA